MHSILSPIRLPRPLALQTKSCDGEVNAWYEFYAITLCYEYLEWIWEAAHKGQRALPVSGEGALMGPFVELVVHEAGHAIFDYLKIPIMGREEDAADQMAALWILTFGQSRAADLLAGIVNLYLDDADTGTFASCGDLDCTLPEARPRRMSTPLRRSGCTMSSALHTAATRQAFPSSRTRAFFRRTGPRAARVDTRRSCTPTGR